MAERMLAPINWIVGIVDKLLSEDTFNDKQQIFLMTIEKEAQALQTLIATFEEQEQAKAKETLNIDGQSHLSSIIGYTEKLLDEVESKQMDTQRDLLFEMRFQARQLLAEIKRLSA